MKNKKITLSQITILTICICFTSCTKKKTTASSTKLDNGTHVTLENFETIKGVFSIISDVSNGSGSACTATAVSHNTALTAAHCMNSNSSIVENRRDNISSIAVYRHPEYIDGVEFRGDLAIVIYPDNSFPEYFKIKSDPAVPGDQITLVGYSSASNDDPTKGDKRWGRNMIDYLENYTDALVSFSELNFNGVGLSGGDSGGPLFVDCDIAGVASRSSSPKGAAADQKGLHTNILVSSNLDWLTQTINSSNGTICGLPGASGCDQSKIYIANQFENETSGQNFPCSVSSKGSSSNSDSDNSSNQLTETFSNKLARKGILSVAARLVNKRVILAVSNNTNEQATTAIICLGELEACVKDIENGQDSSHELVRLNLAKKLGSKSIFSADIPVQTTNRIPMTVLMINANETIVNHQFFAIKR